MPSSSTAQQPATRSCALALLAGCCLLPGLAWAQQPGDYQVQGQDERLAGQRLQLLAAERPSHEQPWPVLDSTRADAAGRFVLRGRVPAPDVYLLRVGEQPMLLPVPLTGQPEQLTVQVVDAPRRRPAYALRLTGSPLPGLLQAAQLTLAPRGSPESPQQRQRLSSLLRAHAASPLAPYLTYRFLLPDLASRPLLDSLAQRFAREQPASPYLARLLAAAAATALAVGQVAPEFTLSDAQGQAVALRSLRGRYVLLDFWASWCQPCRAENPNLRALHARFAHQGAGLALLSVSVDENPAAWQRAVAEDALPWLQMRAEGGVHGAVGRAYQLLGVPATFLLDPDGRLVATGLRGPALTKELTRLLH